jgi:hypothetical protein
LQNPLQTNGDNLNNVRYKTSRLLRKRKRDHLKEKLMSLKYTVRTKILDNSVEA